MKRVLLATVLLGGQAMAAGVVPASGIVIGGPVDSNTVQAAGAELSLPNTVRAARVLTLEEFGAAGDGVTDDSAAAAAACAAAASGANVRGSHVALLHKRYLLLSGWTIPSGCTVQGPGDPNNGEFVNNPQALVQQYFGLANTAPMLVLGHAPTGPAFTSTQSAGVTTPVTGTITPGSNTITAMAGIFGFSPVVQIGDYVTGPGIPAGDTVIDANFLTGTLTLATAVPASAATTTGAALTLQHQPSVTVNGSLLNAAVARQGVTLDPMSFRAAIANLANYSGTGIFVGNSARVKNAITLGNALGISTTWASQWTIDEVRSDDLFGIWMDNVHDVVALRDYEAWPFIASRDNVEVVQYAVTGAANNGSNLVRLAITTPSGTPATQTLMAGDAVTTAGIAGTVGANNYTTVAAVDPNGTWVDLVLPWSFTVAGTASTASQDVTGVDPSHLAVGQLVSGSGIPSGTTVQNIQWDTRTVQLSNTPTASGPVTLTLTQASFSGSGGTISEDATVRPGDGIRVDASEAPTIDNVFLKGHPISVHLTDGNKGGAADAGASFTTIGHLQFEGDAVGNPFSAGILIDGHSSDAVIGLGGDAGAAWSQVVVNTQLTPGNMPSRITGGPLFGSRAAGYGPSNVRVINGGLLLSDVNACWYDFYVGAAGRMQVTGSDCSFSWGYGYETALANVSTTGTLYGDTAMNTVRGGQGVGLGVPNQAGNAFQFPLQVQPGGQTQIGTDGQGVGTQLYVHGYASGWDMSQGAQIQMTNTGGGVPTPTKYIRVGNNGHYSGLNSAASGFIFDYADNGDRTDYGHVSNGAPALSTANLQNCGTSPAIQGNDRRGTITPGAGAKSCTIVFGESYGTAPFVQLTGQAAGTAPFVSSVSASAVTVGFGTAGKFNYSVEQ